MTHQGVTKTLAAVASSLLSRSLKTKFHTIDQTVYCNKVASWIFEDGIDSANLIKKPPESTTNGW